MVQEQPATTQPRETVFDALIASLQGAAAYNRDDVVPPAVILWTDERREWESMVPQLRMVLPQFFVLRKPPNIKWTKDRGKEPERDQEQFPWFWENGTFKGDRINDYHLTNAQKRAARERLDHG
jgi:hypothetical protein